MLKHYLHVFPIHIEENLTYVDVLQAYEPFEQIWKPMEFHEERNCRRYRMEFNLGGFMLNPASEVETDVIGGYKLDAQIEGHTNPKCGGPSIEWSLN